MKKQASHSTSSGSGLSNSHLDNNQKLALVIRIRKEMEKYERDPQNYCYMSHIAQGLWA